MGGVCDMKIQADYYSKFEDGDQDKLREAITYRKKDEPTI